MRLYYFIPVLIIILCHLTCIFSLPITSQPLASNPEHLTWDAWQMPENSGRHPDHKAKKITPKSIFITPNFQTSASHTCPPDHKLDTNKRCIQIVKINEDELLANRIQALLTTSQAANEATDGIEDSGDLYDYDYEEEEGENGPFQLNLPLTFEAVYPEEALPLKAGEETLLPFPAPHRPPHDDDSQTDAGSISYITVDKIANATDEETVAQGYTTNGTTNNDFRDSDVTGQSSTTSGSNGYESSIATITGQTDHDYPLPSSDSTENETSTTDDDGLPSVTNLPQTIPTTTTTSVDDAKSTDSSVSASTESNYSTTVTASAVVTSNDDNFSVSYVSNDTSVLEEMNQAMKMNTSDIFGDPFSEVVTGEMEWINYGNDTEDISDDAFLESESFIVSNDRVTTQKTDTTLEVNENGHTMESSGADVDYPLPSSHTEDDHVDVSKELTVTETTPVFIVTPQSTIKYEADLWHPSLLQTPTRVHHKINGGNNVPQASTPYQAGIEDVEKILLGPTNEQSTEMKEREQAIKHEKNEAYLENLDSNNRFVYHHLTSSTSPKPSVVSVDRSNDRILNQIKEINRIVSENRLRHPNYPTKKQEPTRIRFPTDYNSASHSDITFPHASDFASAQGTRFAPSYNNNYNNNHQYLHFGPSSTLAPPTTSAASPTTKPPFWWLPPNWHIDQSGQKPTLLRFWERMPLVRDPSMMQRSSSRSTRRENSRSPSENLYQEISAQDIYKVLQSSNRDWKHTNS